MNKCVHGTCIEKYCSCDNWYEGDACDRSVLAKYNGQYTGTLKGSETSQELEFVLVASNDDPSEMIANELNLVLTFTSPTRFNIEQQSWRNATWSGEGEFLIGLVSMRLDKLDSQASESLFIEAYRQD